MNDTKFIIRTSGACLAEKEYVFAYVLRTRLGIDYSITVEERNGILIECDDHELLLDDSFFVAAEKDWLGISSLPNSKKAWTPHVIDSQRKYREIPIWYGAPVIDFSFLDKGPKRIEIRFDLFGTIFFMLSRYEEAVSPSIDRYGRYSSKASIAGKAGFLSYPVCDEYVEILWDCLLCIWRELKRPEERYRVFLTHDVDVPFRHLYAGISRTAWRAFRLFIATRSLVRSVRFLAEWFKVRIKKVLSSDPCNTFERMLALSDEYGIEEAFFFIAGKDMRDIPRYPIDDPAIVALMRRLASKGREIGIHATRPAHKSSKLLLDELEALNRTMSEASIDRRAIGCRQHYLGFDARVTPRVWSDAGVSYDSTLSYHDQPGFRAGTCHAFHLYDLVSRKPLQTIERPLIAMEASIIHYQGLGTSPEAVKAFRALIDECRRYDGEFVLLWHNSSLGEIHEWNLFATVMKIAAGNDI